MGRQVWARWLLAGLAAVFLSGCSKSEPRGLVAGRVTLAGKPLPEVTLYFESEEGGSGILTEVDADGAYAVKTYRGAGLPPGRYRVAVRPSAAKQADGQIPLATDTTEEPAPKRLFAGKYLDAKSSGLRLDVQQGNNPPFDIDLEPS